jgi:hypothetical protein
MITKSETIDSFEVIERIDKLETKKREWSTGLTSEEAAELVDLRKLEEQGQSVSVDWEYGTVMYRNDHFIQYIKDHTVDILGIPGVDFPSYVVIDWDKTVENFKTDWTPIWFGDTIYYVR